MNPGQSLARRFLAPSSLRIRASLPARSSACSRIARAATSCTAHTDPLLLTRRRLRVRTHACACASACACGSLASEGEKWEADGQAEELGGASHALAHQSCTALVWLTALSERRQYRAKFFAVPKVGVEPTRLFRTTDFESAASASSATSACRGSSCSCVRAACPGGLSEAGFGEAPGGPKRGGRGLRRTRKNARRPKGGGARLLFQASPVRD